MTRAKVCPGLWVFGELCSGARSSSVQRVWCVAAGSRLPQNGKRRVHPYECGLCVYSRCVQAKMDVVTW